MKDDEEKLGTPTYCGTSPPIFLTCSRHLVPRTVFDKSCHPKLLWEKKQEEEKNTKIFKINALFSELFFLCYTSKQSDFIELKNKNDIMAS